MYTRRFRSIAWLIAAVYLLDGVLAGAAHVHGTGQPVCGQAVCNHAPQAATPHHACGHAHGHALPAAETNSEHASPAAPHDDHCVACRYAGLAASPAPGPIVLETAAAVELAAVQRPAVPAAMIVSLHRSRAPPAAA